MGYTTLVDVETLARHLERPEWVILDCRFRLDDPDAGQQLYERGHIPGAQYADLERDLSGPPGGDAGRHPLPDPEAFRERVGNWGIGSGSQVVAYDDRGGLFAARLWWMLRAMGHAQVAVLDGGIGAWEAAGHPLIAGYERRAPRRFRGVFDPAVIATMDEVRALVARGEGERLIDARDPRRYRGEIEPIDPVAGHIPGARNHPYARNLTDEGRMREAGELARDWAATLGDDPAGETIAYCGSGVSAAHNLLAMAHAGLEPSRLFVASWSGWSADPDRPVERDP